MDDIVIRKSQDKHIGIGGRRCVCCSMPSKYQKHYDHRVGRHLNKEIARKAKEEVNF